MDKDFVTINDIYKARAEIGNVVVETQLTDASYYAKDFEFYIKMESLQRTGSFKLRGAYYKMLHLSSEERSRGVIAASAGNHAQGVAYTARKLGIKATIVMPVAAPLQKIDSTKGYGVDVILYGSSFMEAYDYAKQLAEEKGFTFIEAYDDPYIIAGQGTIGLEIIDQCPDVDVVFVPVGGGGLASGVALAIKSLRPNCLVYGVESENSTAMLDSIKLDKVITKKSKGTIADGIAVARPGQLTFELCKKYLDGIVLVSDSDIARTILVLLEKSKIIAEGAGAIAASAPFTNQVDLKGKKVVSILSGGNIDVTTLTRVIDFALIKSGRRVQIDTKIEDKSSELSKLLHVIAKLGANIASVNQNHGSQEMLVGQCDVSIILETFNFEHIKKIVETLTDEGYVIEID